MPVVDSLRDMLKENIKRFDVESQKHKRLHRQCQSVLITLGAATTVVAGMGLILPETYGKAIQFAVLCLTAIATAVATWAETRRARELWQHEREVYYALIDIQRGVDFVAANKSELTPKDLEDFFQRMDAVLGASSLKWARIQEKKTPQS